MHCAECMNYLKDSQRLMEAYKKINKLVNIHNLGRRTEN